MDQPNTNGLNGNYGAPKGPPQSLGPPQTFGPPSMPSKALLTNGHRPLGPPSLPGSLPLGPPLRPGNPLSPGAVGPPGISPIQGYRPPTSVVSPVNSSPVPPQSFSGPTAAPTTNPRSQLPTGPIRPPVNQFMPPSVSNNMPSQPRFPSTLPSPAGPPKPLGPPVPASNPMSQPSSFPSTSIYQGPPTPRPMGPPASLGPPLPGQALPPPTPSYGQPQNPMFNNSIASSTASNSMQGTSNPNSIAGSRPPSTQGQPLNQPPTNSAFTPISTATNQAPLTNPMLGPPSLGPPQMPQYPNGASSVQYPASQPSRPRYPSYPPPPSNNPVSNGMPPVSATGMPPMPPSSGIGMPPMPPSSGVGMPPIPPSAGVGMPPLPNSNSGAYQPPVTGGPPANNMPPNMNGQQYPSKYGDMNHINNKLGNLSVTQQGFRKLWGQDTIDLLQNRHILPPDKVSPPEVRLQTEQWNSINCDKDIFRCTLNRIPETDALLKKARLPLGVLIHPYKDLSHLPVIQCSTIVRCRSCRTYINPFVHFVDQRRWRCNLCYRVNELPEEFLYDPVSKSYGDPSRRPECKSSTIEFIAPSEYMLRPPQPAVYLFLLDVSRQALESGYLRNVCDILLDELDKLPGDGRTQLGFITYDRTLQFYMMPEGASQVSQLIVGDIDDIFLPSPSDLLINLQSCKEQLVQMLNELPELFNGTQEVESCMGAALKAAYKMIAPTGGRVTVLQCSLPNVGPGALTSREGSQQKDKIDSNLLGPTTDFYKKLALECSGQQVAVDLFVLANQHIDLATMSGISKFSGGQVSSFIGYHSHKNLSIAEKFDKAFRRYLTRKIGFESVMRIRCTRGMSLHTFHGHFFVRSTDLLSLPNVNPDAGFGMQVSIDEDLKDSREVSFQAALLYTSSKGERRIRVHTLCLPTSNSLQEIIQGADQQCIVGLLAKMAVDRSLNASVYDAKEAFINACIDIISRWRMIQCANQPGALLVSPNLSLVPLYILGMLKCFAFTQRSGVPLDERTYSMINMKCLPLTNLIQSVYPDLYRVDQLEMVRTIEDEDGIPIPNPGKKNFWIME